MTKDAPKEYIDGSEGSARTIGSRYATKNEFRTLIGMMEEAKKRISPMAWNYIWNGTGTNVTTTANASVFDNYWFEAPQFSGVKNPDTRTTFMGNDLAFPLLTAPFGADGNFDKEGQRAVGRAAEAAGILQMVPVASSFSLEAIAEASSVAKFFQMAFVGDEDHVLELISRAARAGYEAICVSYSPILQWREHLMEDGFNPSAVDDGPTNFGPGLSNMAMLESQMRFDEPRWNWEKAARVIAASELPCLIKGVLSVDDALKSVDAGAAGLYVSNYGGRTLDRQEPTLSALPRIREAVGADVPIVMDSGIRRGSDIVTALALGADAVAIGRLAALALSAAGERGVARMLDLLRHEFWSTMGHLGCSTVEEITSACVRKVAY